MGGDLSRSGRSRVNRGVAGNADPVLRREVGRDYPLIDRAEGASLYDASGRRFLDAAGSVFVVNIGQGVEAVAEAMAAQARRVGFAHTGLFTSEAEIGFARRLLDLAPPGFTKAWLCTSGSAANETAIKLARHYHLARGEPARTLVVSRWGSYHGSSLGALALTGHTARREPFTPYLFDSPKIDPPYCYRCPLGAVFPACDLACADALEVALRRHGARNVSAFIVEPVSGGPLAALVPPEGYLARIRETCDRNGLLMIADEIVTGAGRTGSFLGVDHSGVVPDVITLAKGIGGGYVPLGAVLVHERVNAAIEAAGEPFRHGETFTGHAVTAAAGAAVLDHLAAHDLVRRAAAMGAVLGAKLDALRANPIVGDVRGLGLLWGLELVADRRTRAPFPRASRVAERVAEAAFARGLLVTAGTGGVDGLAGDAISLAPPFIVTADEVDEIVALLAAALDEVAGLLQDHVLQDARLQDGHLEDGHLQGHAALAQDAPMG